MTFKIKKFGILPCQSVFDSTKNFDVWILIINGIMLYTITVLIIFTI